MRKIKKVYFLSEKGQVPTRSSVLEMMQLAFPKKKRLLLRAGTEFHKRDILLRLLDNKDYVLVISETNDGFDVLTGKDMLNAMRKYPDLSPWQAAKHLL